jgi:hypothetical protein
MIAMKFIHNDQRFIKNSPPEYSGGLYYICILSTIFQVEIICAILEISVFFS